MSTTTNEIRLEFMTRGSQWRDSGRTYDTISAAKYAADVSNCTYRIRVDGRVTIQQHARTSDWLLANRADKATA